MRLSTEKKKKKERKKKPPCFHAGLWVRGCASHAAPKLPTGPGPCPTPANIPGPPSGAASGRTSAARAYGRAKAARLRRRPPAAPRRRGMLRAAISPIDPPRPPALTRAGVEGDHEDGHDLVLLRLRPRRPRRLRLRLLLAAPRRSAPAAAEPPPADAARLGRGRRRGHSRALGPEEERRLVRPLHHGRAEPSRAAPAAGGGRLRGGALWDTPPPPGVGGAPCGRTGCREGPAPLRRAGSLGLAMLVIRARVYMCYVKRVVEEQAEAVVGAPSLETSKARPWAV